MVGRRDRKKRQRRKRIASIAMMVIMVLGFTLAGIVMSNPNTGQAQRQASQSIEYNGYEFTRQQNSYTTEVDGAERQFSYPPRSTTDIVIPDGAASLLQNAPTFWVTFDPTVENIQNVEVARYSLAVNLDQQVATATTKPSPQYSAPVLTCANQTQAPIIHLREANLTQVTVDNNCITVSGTGPELLRATERLVYNVLGVIE